MGRRDALPQPRVDPNVDVLLASAREVARSLTPGDCDTLGQAADAYRGETADDDWAERGEAVASLRDALLTGIRAAEWHATGHDATA
ncbi:hypothetical protein [Terracoccus luteus]|uniref:Uncharacterized protein n=1 Tax=Terracoccus luteus TaxID=53356 RepID=A0A839PWZ1_9MICO|nr:hypothetical protein [Terracoccus luteus]MBB2987244.1 hypothetical protein [Terracoccus luteus]MCP2172895.1 hypothetical protein [Terracoccus luteus]